jgi:holo-[acyl-carrier protein] synthase
MIVGVGIDRVEIRRVADVMNRHPERAAARLFTPGERRACAGKPDPDACFAARFAAKEAFLKALGTGLAGGISWHDVEVASRDGGRPEILASGVAASRLRDRSASSIHVSFSHDGGCAVAIVVIES